MMKVILTFESEDGMELEQKVFGDFAKIEEIPCKTEEDLIQNCQDADAVICTYEPFTEKVMDKLTKLKIISVAAIGYNFIDVEAARNRGIAVTNIPDYCINEVADHAVALMLAANRRLMQFNKSVQEDREWKYDLCPDITRLGESTVGLLGFGNIPRLVSTRLQGFGPKIIAYDPFIDSQIAEEYNVELVDLDKLYGESDYISCHLPLNKNTEKLINKEAFAKMKNGVTFINTGRGGVVDEEALLRAIDSGKVGYACLDVLKSEDPDMKTNPFVGKDNVIITPHVAFYSLQSIRDSKIKPAENVLHYLKGEYSKCNIVNGVNVKKQI